MPLSAESRAQVVILKQVGKNASEIAELLKIDVSTVYRTCNRYDETGSNKDRPRIGRPKVFGQLTNLDIKRLIGNDPFMSAQAISDDLKQTGLPAPQRSTVNLILHDRLKLAARRPAKKPLLNPEQRKRRLEFCMQNEERPPEYWNGVLWSDECSIDQFGNMKTTVRRPVGERYNPRYTRPTMKHPESVMIWACFSSSGRGALHILPKKRE